MPEEFITFMNEDGTRFLFHCPGCQCGHAVNVRAGTLVPEGPIWGWNGNREKPTITPSILVKGGRYPDVDPVTQKFAKDEKGQYLLGPDGRILGYQDIVCHSFVTDGMIQFLSDCSHSLAGQTVPLTSI